MSGEAHPSLCFHYDWATVEAAAGVPLTFPFRTSKYVRGNYSHAAIYRWGFFMNGVLRRAYFGETENLARRIPEHLRLKSCKEPSVRIRDEIEAAIKDGFDVKLEILTTQPLQINNVLIWDGNIGTPSYLF